MRIKGFIKEEIDYLKENCNFSKEEEDFFDLRNDEFTLEQIAEMWECSVGKVNKVSKEVNRKIVKVLMHDMF